MKTQLTFAMALLLATLSSSGHEEPSYDTLTPDSAALERAMKRYAIPEASMRAEVVRETQLSVVDILIAFDISAANWVLANYRGSLQDYAVSCVDKMNFCLAESQLISEFRFRLVGTVAISVDASGLELSDIITGMVNTGGEVVATGEWKKITDAREKVGADIVSVLVSRGFVGNVGLGYSLDEQSRSDVSKIIAFGDWAYNVCSIESTDDGYTQVHEVGHNMGCGHPDGTSANPNLFIGYVWRDGAWNLVPGGNFGPQLYDYSSAYYLWYEGRGYHTIMAYNYGGLDEHGNADDSLSFEPLPLFSSPVVKWNGVPVGTVKNDNRRTLKEVYKYVAQYRISRLPENQDQGAVTAPYVAERAVTLFGVAYDGCDVVGIVELKLGKVNAKKKTSKVSGSVTTLDGKKHTAKGVAVTGIDGTAPATVSLEVKDLGTMTVTIGGTQFAGSLGAYHVQSVFAGTALAEFLPTNEVAAVSGGKWNFAKAASVKWAKPKGASEKELVVDTSKGKTNLSGLKLSYTPKKGTFKGSFNVYALEGEGKATKLKKYKLNVSGVVVGGVGYGVATSKKPALSWPVKVE